MNEKQVREKLAQTFGQIASNTPVFHGDLLSQAAASYEKRHHRRMSGTVKAILQNTLTQNTNTLKQQGKSMQQIQSAAEDPTQVDNPISMLFNLVSILVPNYAFNEVVGVQPMPSDPAPIYYPQLVANEARNGVAKDTVLLGSTNWNTNMTFTTNKLSQSVDVATTSPSITFTKTPEKGRVRVTVTIAGTGSFTLISNADNTGFVNLSDFSTLVTAATLDDSHVELTLASAGTIVASYRYTLTDKPAQARFEFATKSITADPYRLRSVYSLENFYAARQILADYNIDEAMATSVAGYINAEISQNIFDEIKEQADATYTWGETLPTGVSWATHRLSILQAITNTSNGIRANVKRSAGNTIIAGTKLMNVIETLGRDLWTPESYQAEPIGPYMAGVLADKYRIMKNQEFSEDESVMTYKRDDTDASFIAGVFIGLFNTNPLFLDDMTAVSGFGARIGCKKIFDNSTAVIKITA